MLSVGIIEDMVIHQLECLTFLHQAKQNKILKELLLNRFNFFNSKEKLEFMEDQ